MENFKQIVYTELDGQTLMIVPENPETQIIPRPIQDLSMVNKSIFLHLRDFCIQKLGKDLKYVVCTRGSHILDVQPVKGDNLSIEIQKLDPIEIELIMSISEICNKLIN